MAIIQLIISFLLAFSQILAPINTVISAGGEDAFFTEWSQDKQFTEEDYEILVKNPEKDFVILNITDVQLSDDEVYGEMGSRSNAIITKLVEDTQPDLITLTGDNAWDTMAYIELVNIIDSFGIPWAPVMGNHDGQGCVSEFWCCELFMEAENCLFRYGPEDMGYGNYIINIMDNGSIIHSLFMMDTHSNRDYYLNDGVVLEDEYDHLWPNQIKWFRWAVKGISEIEGKVVDNSVFIHIPVAEYKEAWATAWDEDNQCYYPEYADTSFGINYEPVCGDPVNNGCFDVFKANGTKNIICGHDHVNSSSILYEGVRLTYGLKLGEGCYYNEDLIGGTTLTIDSTGNTVTEHHYYNLADF